LYRLIGSGCFAELAWLQHTAAVSYCACSVFALVFVVVCPAVSVDAPLVAFMNDNSGGHNLRTCGATLASPTSERLCSEAQSATAIICCTASPIHFQRRKITFLSCVSWAASGTPRRRGFLGPDIGARTNRLKAALPYPLLSLIFRRRRRDSEIFPVVDSQELKSKTSQHI
jgi:hypothetical protein